MALKVDIEFNQLLQVIRQLPEDKISRLRAELSSSVIDKTEKLVKNFQQLLLDGPVMDNDQFKAYKENRNHFNKWRTK